MKLNYARFAADNGILEAFGERLADGVAKRGDEVDPVGTELGREKGKGDDPTGRKGKFFRHDRHDLAVGKDFRAADIVCLAGGFSDSEAAGEVADDIAHGDGLARRADPFRRDHDGEAFDEVSEDFKRRRAGTDDHGGAKDGDRDASGGEGGFHSRRSERCSERLGPVSPRPPR